MLNLLKNSKNNPHSLAKPTSGFYKKIIDAMSLGCFMPIDNHRNEIPTPKQQISNKKIKVLSHVCAIKNEMKQPTNEIEETIDVTAYNSRTEYVKPFNNIKSGQETFAEHETPKGLLPP